MANAMKIQKSPRVTEVEGVNDVGRKDVLLANRCILISRAVKLRIRRRGGEGLCQVRGIDQVAREDRVTVGDRPIITAHDIVLSSGFLSAVAYMSGSGGCAGCICNLRHRR